VVMKTQLFGILASSIWSLSPCLANAENAWSLVEDHQVQIRRSGEIQSIEGGFLKRKDLIETKDIGLTLSSGNSKIILGTDTVLIINDDRGRFRLYQGSLKLENCSDCVLVIDGFQISCLGATAWIGAQDGYIRIEVESGYVDVFGTKEIQRLKPGNDVFWKNGEVIQNFHERGHESLSLLKSSDLKTWLESNPSAIEDRAQRLASDELNTPKDSRYAVLLMLSVFRSYHWRELLEKGRELLFAQELLSLESENVLLPVSMKRHFVESDKVEQFFDELQMYDTKFKHFSEDDVRYVTFFVRQALAEELMTKSRQSIAWSGKLRLTGLNNSNVNETADGFTAVSETSGTSLSSSLRLDYAGRSRDWGTPGLELNYLDKTYFDRAFEDREYSQFSMKGKAIFEISNKKSLLSRVTPSLTVRSEFINSLQGRNFQVMAYSPQVELVFKPFKELGKYSDFLLGFCSFGVEVRDYLSGQNIDTKSKDKDTLVPYVNGMLMNIVKLGEWRCQEMLVLSVRDAQSDSVLQDQFSWSTDLSVEFSKGNWGLKPSFAYREKSYSDGRDDQRTELGMLCTRRITSEAMELQMGYRRTDQESDLSAFKFMDHQFSLGVNWTF
jgi:hypothetical protein